MPELQAGNTRTHLHKALSWLGRLQRAMEVLWPEWQEDGALQYLGPIDVHLGEVRCSLARLLLHPPHRNASLVHEDALQDSESAEPMSFLSEKEEASLKTESGSGRRVRDWLLLRHYEQFLLALGHHLQALSCSQEFSTTD